MSAGPTTQLVVTGRLRATPGKSKALREALLAMVPGTRQDDGNLGYVLHVSADDPEEFMLIEHWRDQEALAAHKRGAGYRGFFDLATKGKLIAGTPDEGHWRVVDLTDGVS